MKRFCLLLALSAPAYADGLPPQERSRQILQEAESYSHELQRLQSADSLLDIQLRIAKKLQECRKTGYPCQGAEMIALPRSEAERPAAAPTPTPAPAQTLPRLIGVYQGHARLRLEGGQSVEVQPGQTLGVWRIDAIGIDSLELRTPQGRRIRLPLEREGS